jgi:hypothetical protein
MNRKLLLIPLMSVLLSVLSCGDVAAQYLAPRVSIHLSNPLSLLSKAGVGLEYRLNMTHSVLLGYRWYWGFFPGYQGSVEYHRYYRSFERSEAFVYARVGIGGATYAPKPYFSGWETPYNDPGGYLFAGAGAGKRYNFGPFFIQGKVGLKYGGLLEKKTNINDNLFYTTGPASLVDCSLQFGLQFFNEGRHMYYKTLAPRRHSRAW